MAQLEAKDKVQWRAGDTPKASHMRTGVIKEVLAGGLCLVSTKVDGAIIVEEIRMARLKPVEAPAAVKKQAAKPAAKKGRKKGRKKAVKAETPAAEGKAPAKKAKKAKKSKKKSA